jgi:hypothetical protein
MKYLSVIANPPVIKELLRLYWYKRTDQNFDKKYHIVTNHIDLGTSIPSFEQQQLFSSHSKTYEACTVFDTRKAIKAALRVNSKVTNFIDLGSGGESITCRFRI